MKNRFGIKPTNPSYKNTKGFFIYPKTTSAYSFVCGTKLNKKGR
ncbi:hypothetical protein [Aquimarina sp. Aq107]|nr:hypothetical protein [Aquimarina sp. Aq107]